jgi:hypothetical protein
MDYIKMDSENNGYTLSSVVPVHSGTTMEASQ